MEEWNAPARISLTCRRPPASAQAAEELVPVARCGVTRDNPMSACLRRFICFSLPQHPRSQMCLARHDQLSRTGSIPGRSIRDFRSTNHFLLIHHRLHHHLHHVHPLLHHLRMPPMSPGIPFFAGLSSALYPIIRVFTQCVTNCRGCQRRREQNE